MQPNTRLFDDQSVRTNLFQFTALIFTRLSEKYGGGTTLNELLLINYGFRCHFRGTPICVSNAAIDLGMSKSTVSRIISGMRAKGIVTETRHPTDGRRHIIRLASAFLERSDIDIEEYLSWCALPENALA